MQLDALPVILDLLGHENIDISASVISLLNELTEEDEEVVESHHLVNFVAALVRLGIIDTLSELLPKLDDESAFESLCNLCLLRYF